MILAAWAFCMSIGGMMGEGPRPPHGRITWDPIWGPLSMFVCPASIGAFVVGVFLLFHRPDEK